MKCDSFKCVTSEVTGLKVEGALELIFKLVNEDDVFLTSPLPAARCKLDIGVDDVRARNTNSLQEGVGLGLAATVPCTCLSGGL